MGICEHNNTLKHSDPDLLIIVSDPSVTLKDIDVWDPRACHGGTHVSERERQALARLSSAGFVDAYRLHHPEPGRYTWWDYRAGNFYKNFGMRIDHLLVTTPLKHRVVWAEIDREAGKGNLYSRIMHRWSSTSTARAIRSTPAGVRRIRALRRAQGSSD